MPAYEGYGLSEGASVQTLNLPGADRPGIGHAYRVQGPTFLIEFVNNQPDAAGHPASHIHSVWRDLEHDFGGDLLRQHLASAKH